MRESIDMLEGCETSVFGEGRIHMKVRTCGRSKTEDGRRQDLEELELNVLMGGEGGAGDMMIRNR